MLPPASEPEPEPQPTGRRDGSSSGSASSALLRAGDTAAWWEVASRSARFVLCGGVPRCGDPGIDAQRRSLHSMRARWAMGRTFGDPLAGLPLPACLRCRFIPALLVARLLDFARREGRVPQRLPLVELCFKVGRLRLEKFRAAQPERYPCIAVATTDNPAGRRYRIVDGKHRIHRTVADHLASIRHSELGQGQRVTRQLSCSCVVFTVADVLASGALVVVPPCVLPRNGGANPTDQLDSGSVDCAAWIQENAAALGLPDLRPFAVADAYSAAMEAGDDDPSEGERRPLPGSER